MKQVYERYTEDDVEVWNILFERQKLNLLDKGCKDYLQALTSMEDVLNADKIPDFQEINKWFKNKTGWEIECVPGLIPVDHFFQLLSQKKFPSSTWLRSKDKLDYLEEPDMFHDIFGHIPLLSQNEYSTFIHEFGKLGVQYIDEPQKLLQLQRLYWFTIEFGLLNERDKLHIYGAGILSSHGESISSLQSSNHLNFDLEVVLNTEFCTSEIQSHYFIIDDFVSLQESIVTLKINWEYEMETSEQ